MTATIDTPGTDTSASFPDVLICASSSRRKAHGVDPRPGGRADSYTDRPMLEAVGNPVAVNPDRRLAAAAKEHAHHAHEGNPITDLRTTGFRRVDAVPHPVLIGRRSGDSPLNGAAARRACRIDPSNRSRTVVSASFNACA